MEKVSPHERQINKNPVGSNHSEEVIFQIIQDLTTLILIEVATALKICCNYSNGPLS